MYPTAHSAARRFARSFLLWCLLPVLLVGLLNLAVDPLRLLPLKGIEGLTARKPMLRDHERLFKPYEVAWLKPDAVIAGSSRSNYALDPHHPGWGALRAFNLSVSGTNIQEVRWLFEHAIATSAIKSAVIELDMRFFDAGNARLQEVRSHLATLEDPNRAGRFFTVLKTALSWSTLQLSVETLFRQADGDEYSPTGLQTDKVFKWRLSVYGGTRKTFEAYIRQLAPGDKARSVAWSTPHGPQFQGLDDLAAIIRLAYQHGIRLALYISPSHALDFEATRMIYGWEAIENWQRALVRVLQEQRAAQLAGGGRIAHEVQLWDFSGYNSVTTESLPTDDRGTMRYFWDQSHYKRHVGDRILDRVLGSGTPRTPGAADFGTILSLENLEQHLADLRRHALDYRRDHPAEVLLVEHLTTGMVASAH